MPSAPLLPVHHGVSVEGHEKHLAASSGSHRCKKYLLGSKKKPLINNFYYYKKKSVSALGEGRKQELPPTPHGFLCLNLPLPARFLRMTAGIFCRPIIARFSVFCGAQGAGANTRKTLIKSNHLLVNTVIKPPSLSLPKRARFGTL